MIDQQPTVETESSRKLREAFIVLEAVLSEYLDGENGIELWHDQDKVVPDENLAPEDIREIQRKKFQDMARSDLDTTRSMLVAFCESENEGYSVDVEFVPTEDEPVNEEELVILSDYAWKIHLEELEEEARRLPSSIVGELENLLASQGVIPSRAHLSKLKFSVRTTERHGHSVSVNIRDGKFTFMEEDYPITAGFRPTELQTSFGYSLYRDTGTFEDALYDEVYSNGSVNYTAFVIASIGMMNANPPDGIGEELRQMKEQTRYCHNEVKKREDNREIGKKDYELIDLMRIAILAHFEEE